MRHVNSGIGITYFGIQIKRVGIRIGGITLVAIGIKHGNLWDWDGTGLGWHGIGMG